MMLLDARTALGLMRADALNVTRDPILFLGLTMSVLPLVLLSLFGDAAEAGALEAFGFSGMARILGSLAVVMPGAMLGWVIGFLLLEDRDDAVLMALEVTPIGKLGFIAYRLAVCFGLIFVVSLVTALVTVPGMAVFSAIGAAVLAAGHGIVTALFLLAFAANKVEGLALTKLINLGFLAPLIALAPIPWRYVGTPVPPFWIGEMAGLGEGAAHPAIAFGIGLVTSVAVIAFLGRWVMNRLG